jgi:putative transposase
MADARRPRRRFTDEAIGEILRAHASGVSVTELCRKHGITDTTFYRWKHRHGPARGAMPSPTGQHLLRLEQEIRRLTTLAADLAGADRPWSSRDRRTRLGVRLRGRGSRAGSTANAGRMRSRD